MTIHPRRRQDAIHGEVQAPQARGTGTRSPGDCDKHDGIPGDLRCCVRAGHAPPCVAAAAHLAIGPAAVVLSLPSEEAARRAYKIAAMRYCARLLSRMGARDSAAMLRARASAVRAGFDDVPVDMPGDGYYPSVADVVRAAQEDDEWQAGPDGGDVGDGGDDERRTNRIAAVVPEALSGFDEWPDSTVMSDITAALATYDLARK